MSLSWRGLGNGVPQPDNEAANIPPDKIKTVVCDNCANVIVAVKIFAEKHGWASEISASHPELCKVL